MGWIIQKTSEGVLVCRRLPARFDLSVEAYFPLCRMGRLAHQIRQDMWRALQNLRGFMPIVEVTRARDHLIVRAEGQLNCVAHIAFANERLCALLTDQDLRARWLRFAALKAEKKAC